MDNILYSRSGDDEQRTSPEIVTEVVHTDYPTVEPAQDIPVLCYIRQEHGDNQHQAYLVENQQESTPERHPGIRLYQGEADRDEQRTDEVGKEHIGRHFLKVAA